MGIFNQEDEYWMGFALREAKNAFDEEEIPVGAVIIHGNVIVGRGHNLCENLSDPTAHAEMLAITSAAETLKTKRLDGCTIYVTLEPCPMCTGAILNAKIPRVIFGAYDDDAGMCGSVDNLLDRNLLNHKALIKGGVREEECRLLLTDFFQMMRKRGKKEDH